MILEYPFHFYILTNKHKTVLYCGVTNDLVERLNEHKQNAGKKTSFTSKYNCHYLVYYEGYQFIQEAIRREKEVKKWSRIKKEQLINSSNPEWNFLL